MHVGSLTLEECTRCAGVFVDVGVLRRVTADREQAAAVSGLVPAETTKLKDEVRYLKCPGCQKLMNRVNFGRHSGVIVDVCRDHGTWFDRGELVLALEYVAQGGLVKALHTERESLQIERRQAQGPMVVGLDAGDTADNATVLGLMGRVLSVLFDTLS
jgi:Zn-finger nucleic acid-binding protein